MNNEVPDHIRNPQEFQNRVWVSTTTEFGQERGVFQAADEFFRFVAVGNQIHPADCGAILDGKDIKALLSEMVYDTIEYSSEKSHPRIFCVDNVGRLVCIQTGNGFSAIESSQATKVERGSKDIFSPKATEYLERHPEILVEPTPEPSAESGGRVSMFASKIMQGVKNVLGIKP